MRQSLTPYFQYRVAADDLGERVEDFGMALAERVDHWARRNGCDMELV